RGRPTRCDRRGGPHGPHEQDEERRGAVSVTYLGMPPFPEAAAAATGDERLRGNLRHATRTIRGKRAGA
ncbi:hypothetical protein AN219_25875, partial [Streptomyces nanshensis]